MKRESEKKMEKLYTIWQASGQSKKVFAERKKINLSTFYYWVQKFESRKKAPVVKKGFQPILFENEHLHQAVTATIHYPSGIRLEWQSNADTIHLLKTLL